MITGKSNRAFQRRRRRARKLASAPPSFRNRTSLWLPILGAQSIFAAASLLLTDRATGQDVGANAVHQAPAQPSTNAVPLAPTQQSTDVVPEVSAEPPTIAAPEQPLQPSTIPYFGNAQYQPSSAFGSPGSTPAVPFAGTSQLSAPPLFPVPPLSAAGLVHLGFLHLFPHLTYTVSYGNGLQSAPGQRSNSLMNELSPGIFIRLGNHWSIDYTPTLRFYSSPDFKDSVDQVVTLSGSTTYQDWTLGLSQGYSSTSDPLIETASQLSQDVYTTGLTASHPLGSKVSVVLNLNQNFRFIDQNQPLSFQTVPNTLEWSTMDWLSYQIAPRLSAGLGAGFTYDDLSVGPDTTSEQLQGRVSWTVISRLTLSLSGGADYRQFLNSPVPSLLSPIYSGTLQYRLFDYTTLSVDVSRAVTPSYYQNSLSEVTILTAGVSQRLLKRLSLSLTGGYNTTSYHQTATALLGASANNYDSTSFEARLSTVFLKKISASVFFQENFVSSGAASLRSNLYNYTTTQAGLTLGYHF